MSTAAPAEPVIADVAALAAWMDAQGLGAGAALEWKFISGGAQNEIFEIRRGDLHAALRIPPVTAPGSRDAGIVREWRIIEALDGSDVPHTEAIGLCTDPSVLGRTFYLMGFVDGWSPMAQHGVWPAPFDTDFAARRGLAFQLAEGISKMSRFDWRAAGLADLGKPDGFHERQVARWTAFLDNIKGRELPGYDEARAWLGEHKPLDYIPGLMHGDYQFANVMFRSGAPARLAAIVDWEMGTIGDPKMDLAWVVQGWPQETRETNDAGGYSDMSHMPTRAEMLDYFVRSSGRQVDDMDFYLILTQWKMSIVLEQTYQRAGGNPVKEAFGPAAINLMAQAAELAATTDYKG